MLMFSLMLMLMSFVFFMLVLSSSSGDYPPVDACYDGGITFWLFFFLYRISLINPKSSGKGHFFCMIIVEYLGHGIFHPVSGCIILQIASLECLSSYIEE